jgi:hypothetical protein
MAAMTTCLECGAAVADRAGPVHPYVPAAPGCWHAFTELQAGELVRYGRSPAHGTCVDSYMAQHPGDGTGDPRARRSPIVHLVGLCGRLEHRLQDRQVAVLLQRGATRLRQKGGPALAARGEPGEITVTDLAAALDAGADVATLSRLAQRWAAEVWRTWAHEHDRIRRMYAAVWGS